MNPRLLFFAKKHLNQLAAIFCLFPAIVFVASLSMIRPDPELWLSQQFAGYARRDAFSGVNGVLPTFTIMIVAASLCECFFMFRRAYLFVSYIAIGPLGCTFLYLLTNGFFDPAWMTFLAMNTIGMLVSTIVTCVLFCGSIIRQKRILQARIKGVRTH